jgi:hypothetical protein
LEPAGAVSHRGRAAATDCQCLVCNSASLLCEFRREVAGCGVCRAAVA